MLEYKFNLFVFVAVLDHGHHIHRDDVEVHLLIRQCAEVFQDLVRIPGQTFKNTQIDIKIERFFFFVLFLDTS